jgi:uncharacterized protein (DUF1684 family)
MLLRWLSSIVVLMFASFPAETYGEPASPPDESADYPSQILTSRRARDERFRNPDSSPLGVVAIARLDRPRTTVGSNPETDLILVAKGVAGIHAEVLRQDVGNGTSRWLIRPVDGQITDERGGPPLVSAELRKGDRYRVGERVVYFDQLGTFGAVLRASDPACPACDHFQGLSYFPVDARFRVEAEVLPAPAPVPTTIADTNGWRRPAWRYGSARFRLEGQDLTLQLWLFKSDAGPQDEFFIAFKDRTNGSESYGGGRYLDVPFVKSGRALLDFNRAYNPSCAYNTGFACPIPPPENRLPIEIPAGEKVYAKHTSKP